MSTKDIVCAEGELTYAASEIQDYADFLLKSINSYRKIIAGVQFGAIQDEQICARLSALAEALEPYKKDISETSGNVGRIVKKYTEEIEDADRFIFPGDFSSVIRSMLSNFL